MDDLAADGNTVVLVDHDTQVLSHADWMIEMGPDAGAAGGTVIAEGTVEELTQNEKSVIGPYLSGAASAQIRPQTAEEDLFAVGKIHLETDAIHTVHPLSADIPMGRMTAVTGVSGSS